MWRGKQPVPSFSSSRQLSSGRWAWNGGATSLILGTLKKFFISWFLSSSSVITYSAPKFFSLSVSLWMSGLETKHNFWSHLLTFFTTDTLDSATDVRWISLCGKLGSGLSQALTWGWPPCLIVLQHLLALVFSLAWENYTGWFLSFFKKKIYYFFGDVG